MTDQDPNPPAAQALGCLVVIVSACVAVLVIAVTIWLIGVMFG